MKYVMLARGEYRFPVLFPDIIEHSQLEGAQVVSAGFVAIRKGKVSTFGESKSLKKSPRPGDDKIIQTFLSGYESALILAQIG